MTITNGQLKEWIRGKEDEHLEFKEAKRNFHFHKLVKYCAALSNEGGGSIVLGITDKPPRRVVGTSVFQNLERTKAGLVDRLHLRVEAIEIEYDNRRVLVFSAPARPIGAPISLDGAYWMRAGEDLVPMTLDMLRRILEESAPDYSAEICLGAILGDLDPTAIEAFRTRWYLKSKNNRILQDSHEQLLRNAELMTREGVTYAAMILLGAQTAVGRHLAQAEVIFEYRSTGDPGPANQREEFRGGILLYYDRIWELVNLRNDLQHYQDGFCMLDVPTFNERAVREAVLNAVSHRDYRHGGSVFVRQYTRRIEIVSPGGFPAGITEKNLLWQQNPRNRRIAEALARCGLVERSGQGFDMIYGECIRHSKPLPDFSRTDDHFVWLTLHGEIQDPEFLRFLLKVGRDTQASFDTHDLLILDCVHRELEVPVELHSRLTGLIDLGVLERVGHGRGTRYMLSRRLYKMLGKAGSYTRRRGLDREENKAILLRHIRSCGESGAPISELQQVLPSSSRDKIKRLLADLRREGRVCLVGKFRSARWFAVKEV